MTSIYNFSYVFLTIVLTVYAQLIIKWQVSLCGPLPEQTIEKIKFLFLLLLNPIIISGFISAFLASLAWMAAMSKFDLTYIYPMTSLSFAIVLIFGGFLFNEPITINKCLGVSLIIAGTYLSCATN